MRGLSENRTGRVIVKSILELLARWFHAWSLEKAHARKEKHKLMATLTDLTNAITAATAVGSSIAAAGVAVATAIDNAVAKGIGGTAPDVQPQVDAVNALATTLTDATTALNTAKDKLVAATPA